MQRPFHSVIKAIIKPFLINYTCFSIHRFSCLFNNFFLFANFSTTKFNFGLIYYTYFNVRQCDWNDYSSKPLSKVFFMLWKFFLHYICYYTYLIFFIKCNNYNIVPNLKFYLWGSIRINNIIATVIFIIFLCKAFSLFFTSFFYILISL